MPRFSIVIVSYNSADWIGPCLQSVAGQTEADFEVIVLDNASEDGSLEVIRSETDLPIHLIESDTNLGFAAGCNRAGAVATGKWLVFLNPDTVARPDWLAEIRAGQDRHPDVNVFASAQYVLGDIDTLDGVGDAYWGFGIPWRGGFGHPASALPDEGECFSPCGASAVIRKDVFDSLGGFEERFFCYCEDVDLGFRLRHRGERCVFLPRAAVDHKGSAISGERSDFTIYHGTRNRLWTYVRNMPLLWLVLTLPGHVAVSLYLLIRALSIGTFTASLRGLLSGLKGLPWALRSRKGIFKSGSMSNAMAHVDWNPNAMRKKRPSVRPIEPS